MPGGEAFGMEAHEVTDLLEARRRRGEAYLEFLRVASMSCGLYEIPRGGEDKESVPAEDGGYYVVRGRARSRGGGEGREGRPGSGGFGPARAAHPFHDSREQLGVPGLFPLLRFPVRGLPVAGFGSRGAGVILLRPPHALDSAEWPAACGGDCGRVDRRVLDCVARPRVPRAEPTSVHGPRGAWVRRLGCWRADTDLVGSRTRIRVRPRPPWGPRRCRRGLRDCPRPDVLLASLGRRRLASPHRRSRRARHRLDQFGPHRPLEGDAKRWRCGNRSNGGFLVPHPLARALSVGLRRTASPGCVPVPGFAGVIGRTHTLSGSSGITQFQDDFLDFFSARACKSFAVSRDGEPAFLHDSDRGDVVLGRAGVNRAYLYVPQKL